MLKADECALVIIDVQGNLAASMCGREALYETLLETILGIQVLRIPILWCEQVPEKLGPTIPEVADLLAGLSPMAKSSFSCWGEPAIREAIEATARRKIIVVGIEAHVCVYQTCVDLVEAGYEVHVVADAVSSRTSENKQVGLDKIRDAGGAITSAETLLFEMLGEAGGPAFKAIAKIVK